MSQKHIRKASNFKYFRSLARWVWMKAATPKLWTLTTCTVYLILFFGWIPAIFNPPNTLEGVLGIIAMYLIASMIIVGSISGVFAAFWGIFKIERWSVISVSVGIMIYAFVVWMLHWNTDGNRLPQAHTILALLPMFVARFIHVTRNSEADDEELLVHNRPTD